MKETTTNQDSERPLHISTMEMSYMEITEVAYGPDADVYEDVLRVRQDASEEEIQSAFMDRRFELYEALQDASMLASRSVKTKNGKVLTLSERHFIEKKMDALIACFRMLSNPIRRGEYDSTLRSKKQQYRNLQDSPDDVTDSSVFADRSNILNSSLDRKETQPGTPNRSSPSTSGSTTRVLFPENENLFLTPNKDKDGFPTIPPKEPKRRVQEDFKNKNLSSPAVLFDSLTLSNEDSLVSSTTSQHEGSAKSKITRNDENINISSSISVATKDSKPNRHRKVKWSEDVVDNEDYDDKYSVDYDDIDQPVEGCLGISRACDHSNTAISKYLRSSGYENQAGFVDAVNDEITGAMADTMLAFSQVFSAFTIEDDDIDAFVETIDKAADDLDYIR